MNRKEYIETSKHEFKTRLFWRDICVEVVATFILMSVQSSLPLSWGSFGQTPTAFGNIVQVGIGMGFVVCATVCVFGDFGGCHMNPAVTFSMMIAAKMTIFKGVLYMVAQCVGAVAGAAFIYAVTPGSSRESLAATVLHPELEPWQGMLVEVWVTFILICTVHAATNEKRKGNVYMPPIIVGFAVTVGVLSGVIYS